RVALASSYLSIIPAEILAADSGLGFLLQQSSLLVQTNRVFVVLAVFGILGYVSDRVFRVVVSRLLSSYLEAHAPACRDAAKESVIVKKSIWLPGAPPPPLRLPRAVRAA